MSKFTQLALVGAGTAAVILVVVLVLNGQARRDMVVSRATVEPLTGAPAVVAATAPDSTNSMMAVPTVAVATAEPAPRQTSTPLEQPTETVNIEPATPVFFDDFSRVESGWSPLYLDEAGNVNGYSAQAYRLRAAVTGQPIYDIHPALSFRPRAYAVDMRAEGEGSFGLLLGVEGNPLQFASLSYLAAVVSSDGQIVLARSESNGTMVLLEQATINLTFLERDVRLEVEQQSDGVRVRIDGSDVLFAANAQIPDGAIGVYASAGYQPIEAMFDNLLAISGEQSQASACDTLRKLPLSSVALEPSGDDVTLLQRRLIHLGYEPGSSGAFDVRTHDVVSEFQRLNGVTESGVGSETWCRIFSGQAIGADGRSETEQIGLQFRPIMIDSNAGLDVPMLASVRQNDKTWQIGLMLPGTNKLVYVDTDGDALDPVWSPDRQYVAFTSNRSGTDAIWLLDVVEGTVRQVSPADRVAQYPVWSPDGGALLYTDEPGPDRPNAARLYIYTMETAQTRLLVDQHGGWADWSINNEIVFSGWSGKSYDLFRINPDGSGLANITNTDDRHEDIATWSPDGLQLAYVVNPPGNLAERQIFARDRNGSTERQLITQTGPNSNPVWLSNTTLVFANQPATDVWQPWLIGSDGSNSRQLSRNEGRVWFMNRASPR